VKIAAIDIGTNSIHMVIAQVEERRIFEIIDREKEMVFLGRGGLLKHRLTEDAIVRGLSTMISFKAIADSHKVDQIITTATSAVREASNGRVFVKLVKMKTGIDIRILPGKQEARIITLAVRDVFDLRNHRALIVDIGGGSVELIVADARHVYLAESIKAGVIRLTERFINHDIPTSKEIKRLRRWLDHKLEPISKRIQNLSPNMAIGTSGTILALGQMLNAGESLSVSDLEKLNEDLATSSLEERQKMPGLDRQRADQIVAGGILLETVMEKCRANKLMLCDRALREGLIADYLIKRAPTRAGKKLQARELRGKSVLNLMDRWEIDREHADHSARLALQLFDALEEVHGLGRKPRQILEYASLLHDIGRVISYPRHHRHGWYIIKNSNLIGFRAREIDMLAAIVAYHRTKRPKRKDTYLAGLKSKDRRVVGILSAILRVSDGLDRQHNQMITRIKAVVEEPRHLVVSLFANEPALIPLRAAAERSDLLQKTLKLKQVEFRTEMTSASQSSSKKSSAD
jgi:exopolyphosphatase / guanosine-5'-triphosphate,3'-diphosphate pyrophosphatase